VRANAALSEPSFVCGVERRNEAASGPENIRIPADCVRIVDEIEDRVDPIRVSRAQRVYHLDGFRIVDFFGTEAAGFTDLTAKIPTGRLT
jgi:hypothetical protein